MYTMRQMKQFLRVDDWRSLIQLLRDGYCFEPVTVTANTVLTLAEHGNRTVIVNKADGAAITLPAAKGTGTQIKVYIGTTITSNSTTIKCPDASNSFFGGVVGVDTDLEGATGYTWNADAGDDTITMQGAATGGVKGDFFLFEDVAEDEWAIVGGYITQSGASEATPFSATVS